MESPHILLVDDEPDFLEGMKATLEAAGFKVSVATGGAQGVYDAITFHPDLVISDMRMNDVNGIEFLQRLRTAKVRTRFMFMTAYDTDVRSTVTFVKLGACGVIHKEFASGEIVAEVKRVLTLDGTLADEPALIENRLAEMAVVERNLNQARIELQQVRSHTNKLLRGQERHAAAIKLLFFVVAVMVTIIFHRLGMIESGYSLFVLPCILFVLLSLPFDRIKTLIAKLKKAEGKATFK